jgi:hypothetical protein
MSKVRVSIRLGGDIGDLEALARVADGLSDRIPYKLLHKGELRGRSVQPANVLSIPLADWERGGSTSDMTDDERDALRANERAQLAAAAGVVARLAPALAAIDSSRTTAELWVSTIREEDMGGFGLPADLVAAVAAAGMPISLSILVLEWPDDDADNDDRLEDDTEDTERSTSPAPYYVT